MYVFGSGIVALLAPALWHVGLKAFRDLLSPSHRRNTEEL